MQINLNLRSDIPIYIQIVEQVRQQVVSGGIKPGDQLPTVRALASDLRVNFNTVARAYRLLDEAGVITTMQGRGTFILEMPPPEVAERLRHESLEVLAKRYLNEAKQLGFDKSQSIQIFQETAQNWQETALPEENE